MCGIVGFITGPSPDQSKLRDVLYAMTDQIVHRGPDSYGHWCDPADGIALGHRRLAVIDLSPEGHQPMISRHGRYVISYNGEIYNFLDLKHKLVSVGHSFKGSSDTEVILAAIEQWNIEDALKKFSGMFAFALWDRHEKVLILARDRIGEKPLYYGLIDDTFLFGSELKALRKHPVWKGDVSREALHLLLRYTYIPSPDTIHKGIHKLQPGTYLRVQNHNGAICQTSHTYWSIVDAAIRGQGMPVRGSEADIADEFEQLLSNVVRRQMIADVPLGAFLSGGVDSSIIVALMQAQSSRRIKTFSIGFHEQQFNEAEYAKAVAMHLGTEHTEFYVAEQDVQEIIPELPTIYDEPFADYSQIPTCLLTRLTRQKVTVALSGDGGDELFFGYNRHHLVETYWRKLSIVPQSVRHILASLLAIQANILKSMPIKKTAAWGYRLERYAELFDTRSPQCLNETLTAYDVWSSSVVPLDTENCPVLNQYLWETLPDIPLHMMLLDLLRYLPDDILVKVDRAAMAVSLETRIPLLDHILVEYVLRLPFHLKYRENTSKWLLRRVLYKHVPRKLIERPKMGFGIPIDTWLCGSLRDWAESLLSESALASSGMINTEPVRKKWLEHQSGYCNWKHQLWPVLMFQAWHQQQRRLL